MLALAPPAALRIGQLLEARKAPAPLFAIPVDWWFKQPLDFPKSWQTFGVSKSEFLAQGVFVGSSDAEAIEVHHPLGRLCTKAGGVDEFFRVHTIDQAFGNLIGCSLVVVESLDLLRGAQELLREQSPAVCVGLPADLSQAGEYEACMAELGYRAESLYRSEGRGERFGVFRHERSDLTVNLKHDDMWVAAASGVSLGLQPQTSGRMRWTGEPMGVVLQMERPKDAYAVEIGFVDSVLPEINFFVDGQRIVTPSVKRGTAGGCIVHLPLWNTGSPESVFITFKPVTMSTTERSPGLVIDGIWWIAEADLLS